MFKSLLSLISILAFSFTQFSPLILAQYDPYPDIPECVVSPPIHSYSSPNYQHLGPGTQSNNLQILQLTRVSIQGDVILNYIDEAGYPPGWSSSYCRDTVFFGKLWTYVEANCDVKDTVGTSSHSCPIYPIPITSPFQPFIFKFYLLVNDGSG